MKNQQGIIWAPILIMLGVVVVTGVGAYLLIQAGNTSQNNNANVAVVNQTNSNANTNSATNTNQVVNNNASVNTNTATESTAGWKTYTNSTFGYQMKYPADYSAKDASKGSTLSKGTLNGSPYYRVDVVVYETPITSGREGQDIYTWAKNGFPQDANVEKEHANLRQVTLGGITYWASDGDLGSTPIPDFMVFHDNKLFVLTDYRTVDKTVDTNLTIISTFKFTDPTATWKTYKNPTRGYSIKYPPTWTATTNTQEPEAVNIAPPEPNPGVEITHNLIISPTTKIDASDCRNVDLDDHKSTVVVNGASYTRTVHGCLFDWISTYFPQPSGYTGYYDVTWAKPPEGKYPEYELMLSTFRI